MVIELCLILSLTLAPNSNPNILKDMTKYIVLLNYAARYEISDRAYCGSIRGYRVVNLEKAYLTHIIQIAYLSFEN